VRDVNGPNYAAAEGHFTVTKDGKPVSEMSPQKRRYNASGMPMTEASIDTGLFRDLYVSMGEPIPNTQSAWAVRVYYKPFVDWIWAGCVLMALGGVLAISDRRYRIKQKNAETIQKSDPAASGQAAPVISGHPAPTNSGQPS